MQGPPFLEDLPHPLPERAMEVLREVLLDYGALVTTEGDEDPTAAYILEGEVTLYRGETEVATLRARDLIGAEQIFTTVPRLTTVRAGGPGRILVVDREGYHHLSRGDHPAAYRLEQGALQALVRRLKAADERLASLAAGAPLDVRPPTLLSRMWATLSPRRPSTPLDPVRTLGDNPLFAGAPPEVLADLAQRLEVLDFDADQAVFVADEPPDGVYLLNHGAIDVLVPTQAGNAARAATLAPGSLFGLTSALTRRPHAATCVAQGRVTALHLPDRDWNDLIEAWTPTGTALRTAGIRALTEPLAATWDQIARRARDQTTLPSDAAARRIFR